MMIEKVKNKKLALRIKPVISAQINKPVIITAVLFLAVLVALILFSAFSTSQRSSSKKISLPAGQVFKPAISPLLKSLPKSYADTETIKKYLDTTPKISVIPPEVQQEIELLKQQQELLQQRLSNPSTDNNSPHPQNEDIVQIQQAKNSGLFFPGVAPPEMKPVADEEKSQTDSSTTATNQNISDKQTSYEQQNMQAQKINFMKPSDEDDDIYNKHNLVKPISPYEIQAGTIIPAELITGINTSLPGDVVAQIQQDIFDTMTGRFLLIPKGSKLLGKYDSQIAYGQERVLIVFYRVIRPDGSSILLSKAAGADLLGQSGMQGNVNNHWAKVIGAATLSTLLSVGAGVASDNVGTNNTYYRSASQNAALGAASGVSSTGQQLTNQAINIQPTLTIPVGHQFNIIVNKDMILEPYHESE